MALQLVGLHNTYRDFAGNPASGQVIFQPQAGVLQADQDTTWAPLPITVTVVDGELQATLAAPLTALDGRVAYVVTEQLAPLHDGANLPPYLIIMPAGAADGAVLELSDRDTDGLIPATGNGTGDGVFGDDTFGSDNGGFG